MSAGMKALAIRIQKNGTARAYVRWGWRLAVFLLGLLLLASGSARATPLAGTLISNQASAHYLDSATSQPLALVSNTVQVTVQQIASFLLTNSQSRQVTAGQRYCLPHQLTNTGNGLDSFSLNATAAAGALGLSNVAIYADANADGSPDAATTINSTGGLAAGATFNMVVCATVSPSAPPSASGQLIVMAAGTATATPAAVQTNTDTLVISNLAVLSITKSFALVAGRSPNNNAGAHIAVTLNIKNDSNSTASNVQFSDVIGAASAAPAYNSSGLAYIGGSARWNGLPLTDGVALDPAGINYAAISVAGVTNINGVLNSLAAGAAAQVTFLVDVLPGLAPGSAQTNNAFTVLYMDGQVQQTTNSNVASYTVTGPPDSGPTPDLTLSKSHVGNFTVGMAGTFNLVVSNVGTAATSGSVVVRDTLPTVLSFLSESSGGNGWTCDALGQIVTCSTSAVIAAGAKSLNLPISVMPTAAAQVASPLLNSAQVSGGAELAIHSGNNSATDIVLVGLAATVAGRVWLDVDHNRLFDVGEVLVPNWQVELLDSTGKLVTTALTDFSGAYLMGPIAPGNDYQLRFRDPSNGVYYATPVNGEHGTAVWPGETIAAGLIQNMNLLAGSSVTEQSLPLDPGGVVYDSVTRLPVPGATVRLLGPVGFDPLSHLFGGAANAVQVVGLHGYYQFLLLAGAPAGNYQLQVTAPVGYNAPSTLIPSETMALTPPGGIGRFLVQVQSYPPPVGSATTYYLILNLAAGVQVVVNNHIPLDPVSLSGAALMVSKVASRNSAEPGDFVDYTVLIKNSTQVGLPATNLLDKLPRGFRYAAGSARLNHVTVADPIGGAGPQLSFALGTLAPNTTLTLTYRIAIGVTAPLGNGVNSAQASSGAITSNTASATVQIARDVFSDKAYVLGTVYLDCNRNRVQDDLETGIPGVRLFLEEGTSVVTDGDGKYSLYGVSARTHVLKLDASTLPTGLVLVNLANRNAGNAGSRFVDLKNGELHRADFASDNCAPEIMQDVALRHQKSRATETESSLNYRLNLQAGVIPPADPRALPASGELAKVASNALPNNTGNYQALMQDIALNAGNSNLPAKPLIGVALLDMERLLPDLDNSLDFVDLKDKDVLPNAQATLRVKGRIGSLFSLVVNGQNIGQDRVGKKTTLPEKQLEAWDYIGVSLKPGQNLLTIKQLDLYGNERDMRSITVVAPDQLAHIVIDAPKTVEANGRTPFTIQVRLLDAHDVAVTSRTYLTLEAAQASWQVKDLDPKEPGIQVSMEGGKAIFELLPPTQPGEENLRISSGILGAERHIAYVPELRPMIVAGLIEGSLNMRSLNPQQLIPPAASDSFEQQIERLSREVGNGTVAARTALFLKGKVKGDYLLTLAYDSDKGDNQRLFRDIQPDEFYPVYGDSSSKGFDAQSTSRLFVRVDKGLSYLLYGDYVTQSAAPARSLSQYNRSLTGIKEHFENDRVMVNAFASRDTNRQVIQEIAANGTSGPFQLTNGGALINSEQIEILTRDRNQPTMILRTEAQSRFTDYEIEPYTGRVLFRGPIASFDANLNPRSIRVTYEIDQGGPAFWVTGVDAQMKLTNELEIGGVLVRDSNPLQPMTLTGLNASFKVAEKTVVIGEVAHTSTLTGQGSAERVEMRHESGAFNARAYVGRSDEGFENAASMLSKGRRESGAKGTYRVNDSTTISAEIVSSADQLMGGSRDGILLKAEHNLSETWRVEVGLRKAHEISAVAGTPVTDDTALLLKVTAQIASVAGLSINAELEQDIHDSGRKVVALGAQYQVMNRGRLYARHEFVSSLPSYSALNSSQLNNTTVLGLDTDYSPNTHLFSEYRVRSALDGRESESAIGLRNKWQLAEGLRLNTSAERIISLAGAPGRSGQAYTGAIEYTADPLWKGSARLEYHDSDAASGWLNSIDVARKLNNSWTAIAKEVYSENSGKGASTAVLSQQRLQLGLAWRDSDAHEWNGLGKLEHRRESDSTVDSGINRTVDILSVNANYQPRSTWQASGHYAAKWVTDGSLGLDNRSFTQLASARVMWDISKRWDAGITASVLGDRGLNSMRYGLGAEVAYLVQDNLWLSFGYNLFGFEDTDTIAQNVTDKGAFVRLRFKFDEDIFSGILGKLDRAKPPTIAARP